jgi:hypothetical protein
VRGMDLLIKASRYLRTMIGKSSRNWTRNCEDACWQWRGGGEEVFVLPNFQGLIPWSHLQGLVHRHQYSWTLEIMIQINHLHFKGKFLLLKLLIVCGILYFCKFLVSINIFIFFVKTNYLEPSSPLL